MTLSMTDLLVLAVLGTVVYAVAPLVERYVVGALALVVVPLTLPFLLLIKVFELVAGKSGEPDDIGYPHPVRAGDVTCPACGAGHGQMCNDGRGYMEGFHKEREYLAVSMETGESMAEREQPHPMPESLEKYMEKRNAPPVIRAVDLPAVFRA